MTEEEIKAKVLAKYPEITGTALSAAVRSWKLVAATLKADPESFFLGDSLDSAQLSTVWGSAWYVLPGSRLVEYYDFVAEASRAFDVTTFARVTRVRLDFTDYDPAAAPKLTSLVRIEGSQDNNIYMETSAAGPNCANLLEFARLLIDRIQ